MPALPPPDATDPVKLGIMQGMPAPAEKRVTLASVLKYPNSRWAFHHMRELGPTINVSRGEGPATPLPPAKTDINGLTFDAGNGTRISIADWQKNTYTDALLVLRRGRVVHEEYHVGMGPSSQHALWSMSKSFIGLLATMMIQDGSLDPKALVSRYVPELAQSAWGNATVQATLDMTAGVAYRENFADPKSDIFPYLFSTGLIPVAPNYPGERNVFDYLKTVKPEGQHDAAFRYKSVDTEVMGWVLRRASGKSISELLSERLWSKLGAEQDAYYWLDPAGSEVASVGLNATLRDIGRVGEFMRLNGRLNGKVIVPEAVVQEIRKGASRDKFAATGTQAMRQGYSYHNQWWISHDADGSFEAKGLNGQHLHVNPAAEIVIVKLSSHPFGDTQFTHVIDRAAFATIAQSLRAAP